MTTGGPRIGVIGPGRWATRHHIPSLIDYGGCRLTALADTNAEHLASVAKGLGDVATFLDPAELLGSGLVDGVVIAAPHPLHYPLVKAALEAGVSVFVEKPLTLRASEAWELVALADRQGVHLMVGYTHQMAPTAQRLRQTVQSGDLGDLVHVSVFSADAFSTTIRAKNIVPHWYANPNVGGGLAHMQTTHSVGMMFYVTGRRVVNAFAYMYEHDQPVDVVDAIAFRLDNGAVGTVASTGSLPHDRPTQKVLRYYGTQGFALQDLVNGTLDLHYNDGPSERIEAPAGEAIQPREPVRRFADLLAGRAENPAPGAPAARAVELIEAAYRSAAEGRPVPIDEQSATATA